MTDPTPSLAWSFRLKLLTGLALFVLLVMVIRARADRTDLDRRHAALRSTLAQLVALQQEQYARSGRYVTGLDSLPGWSTPPDLRVEFTADDDQDWRAVATDPGLLSPPRSCGVFLGRAATAPHRAVLEPGVPACW